jgi:hypothetical protein
MKKTITFALLMLASIGVFANQKTPLSFKEVAPKNSINFDYQNTTSFTNVTNIDYQDVVLADDLTEANYQEDVFPPVLMCGEYGEIHAVNNDGSIEIIGYWYTTCAEQGPPFPKHYYIY